MSKPLLTAAREDQGWGLIVTQPSHAVFLSYTSQDSEAAGRIAAALRSAGIEVWLDQSELRGGDVWDQKIRREIQDCALFIPIISQHTQARLEGYFRLEWDLADQRTHRMARARAFVVPVCVDTTREASAEVPESFQRVQWTRLPNGETPPAFVERLRRLLTPEPSTSIRAPASSVSESVPLVARLPRATGLPKGAWFAILGAILLGSLAYVGLHERWISTPASSPSAAQAIPSAPAFDPPPHSIAVLPFVNLSGEKEQEYFSDGLTEELLNSLAEINELQVAARTSAFSFKGKDTSIATIAHSLNVRSILEGSVRRSGHTVRVTAQLINAVTGFHAWSKTYDRDLGDVLKLQAEIATAVASALKVTLLGDISAKIETGGTRNATALDSYLRGATLQRAGGAEQLQLAITAYTRAIDMDPNFALAIATRSRALTAYTADSAVGAEIREGYQQALADAHRAVSLAPELAEAHVALGRYMESAALDFSQAESAYQRALALAPGNAEVLDSYARFAGYMGRTEASISAARRAVALDPLNASIRRHFGYVLASARHYTEAIAAHRDALALNPDSATDHAFLGIAYYLLGDFRSAQSSCEGKPGQWAQNCLALAYHQLGRHADAQSALTRFQATAGDDAAYQYATIYAQWGNTSKALEWLDTALRMRDPGMVYLKTDALLDPLRKEPRFQAILRELKFPG